MKINLCIDWLNFTAENRGDPRIKDYVYPLENKWEPIRATNGYNTAYESVLGARVQWSTDRRDMGVHVQYSGATLNRYRDNNVSTLAIARFHSDNQHRCGRIDIAFDVVDSVLQIELLYRQIANGEYLLPFKRKASLVTSTDGVTMYVGSRTSDLFLRVYDKGAEQKTDDNWKRVELEVKGTRAMFFLNLLVREGEINMGQTARDVLRGVAAFNDPVWQLVIGDEPLHIGKAKNAEPDTKDWLITQVAPAMGRYIAKSGDQAIVEQFWSVVAAFSGKATEYASSDKSEQA